MNARLLAFRAAHGLTQKQAAALLGVPHATWRGWERGVPVGPAGGPVLRLLTLIKARPELLEMLADVESVEP
jgi:DNA-binding transcriptional regulator YiaG